VSRVLVINGQEVPSGRRVTLELPLPLLYTHTPLTMSVQVVRGRREGPRLFVCAAIHGDEINGVEIIRRLLRHSALQRIRGDLIAIPIVNVYGVLHQSRYLPDRRDLNRSFPGSDRGSMASRIAALFMQEIVSNCTHGIDLHTGAAHRTNLPHVRGNLEDEETARLARVFDVPVLINADTRDGSLREAAAEAGIPMLLYEAGEALRFDEIAIRAGVRGIINVMRELEMLPRAKRRARLVPEPFVARTTYWVRAPESGILRTITPPGQRVKKNEILGLIANPFGDNEFEVRATYGGIIIGRANIPLVHEGEALFHIARFGDVREVAQHVESFQNSHADAPYPDSEPPIV
jgi:predicted deacylase